MQLRKVILLMSISMTVLPGIAQNQVLPLWENDPPNYQEAGEVTIWDTSDIVRVRLVQQPDIAIFLPSKKNATGEAVVICPGGGYNILAYDWEGTDIARWFNSQGIAAFVLKYRLPGSKSNITPYKSPLLDAQRALRLVRFHSAKWNIDSAKIGIVGFSAGGHLASTLSTHYDGGDSTNTDPVDQVSCRPDFSVLVYPVISFNDDFTHAGSKTALLGENPDPDLVTLFSNELQVTPDTPPAILIHSEDDRSVPVENSLAYFRALRANNITSELHVYPYGGHGYSLAIGNGHLSAWPDRVIEWIRYLYP